MRGLGRKVDERPHLVDEVTGMLRSLGNDPTTIARRLRDLGVRGTPGSTTECAIARFLSAVVAADPGVRMLKVYRDSITVVPSRWWRLDRVVELGEPLCRFVARFDEGGFPELIEEGAGLPAPSPVT